MRLPTKILSFGAILLAVFCVSFFFFYKRAQSNLKPKPLILTSRVINQPLPHARLVNISGERLDDERLRRGKVVLLFTMTNCGYCEEENNFLKTVAGSRKDVKYFYVIPFGEEGEMLKEAQQKYPFETYYDEGSMLSRSLQILQVPIQVYLEDGVIKKTWVDATVHNHRDDEYKRWLSGV